MKQFLDKKYSDVKYYELNTEGKYQLNLKNKNDFKIIMAQSKNVKLPFVKCNELLGYNQGQKTDKNQGSINIYHPIQILQPVEVIEFTHNINKQQVKDMFRSTLTASSEKQQFNNSNINNRSNNNNINNNNINNNNNNNNTNNRSNNSINNINNSNIQRNYKYYNNKNKLQQLLKQKSRKVSLIIQDENQKQLMNQIQTQKHINKNIDSKNSIQQHNKFQTFNNLDVFDIKSNRSNYQQIQKQHYLYKNNNQSNNIKQNKSQLTYLQLHNLGQKQKIKYKTRLLTLFDSKNLQSQSDLARSINLNESHEQNSTSSSNYFNFGKVAESKIMGVNNNSKQYEHNNKQNNSDNINKNGERISKMTTNIYNSVIQANLNEQAQNQQKKQPKKYMNLLQPKRKFSQSKINQYRKLSNTYINLNNIRLKQNHQEIHNQMNQNDQPIFKINGIKGLRKGNQRRQDQSQYNHNNNHNNNINDNDNKIYYNNSMYTIKTNANQLYKLQQKIQTPRFRNSQTSIININTINKYQYYHNNINNQLKYNSQKIVPSSSTSLYLQQTVKKPSYLQKNIHEIQQKQTNLNVTGEDFVYLGFLMIMLVKQLANEKIKKSKKDVSSDENQS